MSYSSLIQIIQSNLEELITLPASHEHSEETYRLSLISYLKCDIEGLRAKLDHFSGHHAEEKNSALPRLLIEIRLAIRTGTILKEQIEELKSAIATASNSSGWLAEASFVLALAYEARRNYVASREAYLQAATQLSAVGAQRKSIKALLNAVASESRIDMASKRIIADYMLIYNKAKTCGEPGVAGVALYNVSLEFQREGALSVALRFCERSLALLRHDYGTLHYYSAVVHRCHLLLQLGRRVEAADAYDLARVAPFKEIQDALRALPSAVNPAFHYEGNIATLLPTWEDRLVRIGRNDNDSSEKFGALEVRLLQLLSRGPKEKHELIELLYGNKIALEHSENRLKVLLSRVRKKRPGLICRIGNHYKISDYSLLSFSVEEAG